MKSPYGTYALSTRRLAKALSLTREEAEALQRRYFALYPELAKWAQKRGADGKKTNV